MQKKLNELKYLFKFGVSGVFVTALAYIIYLTAYFFTKQDFLSVVISYFVVIPISFHLNSKYVFCMPYKSKAIVWFVLMQLLAMIINYFAICKLNTLFPRHVSALLSYGLIPVIVYLLSRLVIFKK